MIDIVFQYLFFYVYDRFDLCLYICHMCAWSLQRSEEGTQSPELELQKVVNHCVGPGTEPRSSASPASALNL